jgi:hypothetical protein
VTRSPLKRAAKLKREAAKKREKRKNDPVWAAKTYKNQRRAYIKRTFGITEADYEAMFVFQGGVCAICKRPPKKNRLSVDHDHKTGLVRGLLSHVCNRAISMLGHDQETLRLAIQYLENPPALTALNGPRYGIRGRVTLRNAARLRAMKFVRKA